MSQTTQPQGSSSPSTLTATTHQLFTTDPSLTPKFSVPLSTYFAANPTITYKGTTYPKIKHLAVGTIVISPPAPATSTTTTTDPDSASPQPQPQPLPRVLLIRRAASDSMPNLWEVPGGTVDDTDATILHGAARELLEESGLRAAHIGPLVRRTSAGADGAHEDEDEGQVFLTRTGNLVAKFHFLVEVPRGCEGAVKCDPEEHSEWVWATEAEVEAAVVGGRAVQFTTVDQRQAVLNGFRLWRKLREEAVRANGVTEA